jgi:hypothetical protein
LTQTKRPPAIPGRFKVYTDLEKTDDGYTMPLTKYSELDSLIKLVSKFPTNAKWCGPFDEDVFIDELEVELSKQHPNKTDTKTATYLAHRNLYLYCKVLDIIVWNSKSLVLPSNRAAYPYIFRKFRNDVREIFQNFVAGNISDEQIEYLDISREYETLI